MSMFEVLPSLKFLYKCHCTLHLNLASEMDPHFTLYLNCFLLFSKCLFVRRKRKAQSHQLLIQIFSCLANFCRRLPAGNENIKWDNPQQTSGLRQSPPRPGTHRGRGRRTSFVRYFMRFHFDRNIKIDIARASIEYLPCLTYETLIMRHLCTVPRPPRLASLVSCLISHDHSTLHSTTLSPVTAVVPGPTLSTATALWGYLLCPPSTSSSLETCVCSSPCLCSWQGFNHFAVAQNSADSQKPLSTKHKRTAGKLEGLTSRLTHWF